METPGAVPEADTENNEHTERESNMGTSGIRPERSSQEWVETFRERRQAWAETAGRLVAKRGLATKQLNNQDEATGYSYLGAGLQTFMDRDPGIIRWNGPWTAWDGSRYQSVDDTTVTVAEYYGISTELVDLLEEMELEGHSREELNEMVARADCEFVVQDEQTRRYSMVRAPAEKQGRGEQ